MKNNIQNTNLPFEHLLRKSFLENNNPKLIDKTIEMNANYIFNSTTNISISEAKLEHLISRHRIKETVFSQAFIKFIYWIIPSILFLSIVLFIGNKYNKKPDKNYAAPIINERDTCSVLPMSTKRITSIKVTEVESKIPNINKPEIIKSEKKETKREHKSTSWHKPVNGPKIRMSYPDLYQAPAPTFEDLELNSSYKLMSKAYYLPSEIKGIAINKQSYYANYYANTPFNNGFEDFVYINPAERINNTIGKSSVAIASTNSDTTNFAKKFKSEILIIPYSLRYHLEKYNINKKGEFVIDTLSNKQLDLLLKPFYFSKYELSIKEYREFAQWVYVSNGYNLIVNSKLRNSDSDAKNSAYYMNWLEQKDHAFQYTFFNPSELILKALKGNTLNIAPLDSVHINNNNSYMMPYEINPFYSKWNYPNYPIVGISYYQALAFLDWKTHFHQEKLDNDGQNIEIEYCLPSSLERRLVIEDSDIFSDENWLCDLKINQQTNNNLDYIINSYCVNNITAKNLGLFPISNSDNTLNQSNFRRYSLPNNIAYLGSNISEWMSDSYTENWESLFMAHKMQIEKNDAGRLSSTIEDFYNRSNNRNGQMVMGGNFLDQRFGTINIYYGKKNMSFNKLGVYLKKYIDPKQQYSTVGFRYIVKIKDPNENKKEALLQLLGSFDYDKYKNFPEDYINEFKVFDNGKYIFDKEITNGMWRSFLMDLLQNNRLQDVKICLPQSELWKKYNPNYIYYFRNLKYDDLPVVNISHKAANIFNQWLSDKYNSYALRKYGIVEFKLPSEDEWEKAARGTVPTVSQYAWADVWPKDFKGNILANLTISPYELHHFSYPNDSLYKKEQNQKMLSMYLRKGTIPNNQRLDYYEDYLLNKISYQKFIELYEKDWLKKDGFRIYASNEQIKRLEKNKSIFEKQHLLTIGKIFPPNSTGLLDKKSDGLYDIEGNVAEMIENSTKTKGGSWNSFANFSAIRRNEPWNGKASPTVGLRPVMKVLYKGFDHNSIKTKNYTSPPGTILLQKNFGVDYAEIRNVDYREFIYYTMQVYGKNSQEYIDILPDTTVWNFEHDSIKQEQVIANTDSINPIWNKPFVDMYLRHPAFANYPVVGLTYEQVQMYCKWRSKIVNEYYAIFRAKSPLDKTIPSKVTYRLPTQKEWEMCTQTDSVYSKEGYYKPNAYKKGGKEKHDKKMEYYLKTYPVYLDYPSTIGLFGVHNNLSEMTNIKGKAKGENWAQKYNKQTGENIEYFKAESWLGFRCVVDIEYKPATPD